MYVFAENLKDFQCHFVSSCRGFHIIYPRCSQGQKTGITLGRTRVLLG